MKFTALDYKILNTLAKRGYNILTSNNKLDETTVYWFPEKVECLNDFLMNQNNSGQKKEKVLVIQDALKNIDEYDLAGIVFV